MFLLHAKLSCAWEEMIRMEWNGMKLNVNQKKKLWVTEVGRMFERSVNFVNLNKKKNNLNHS